MRNISIVHPVTNGQVCLSVEYVEGHDPNPSCFVMFRCIATAGHDMSTVINGTMMCVHLSPQVYTIVATDTMNDINTTTPVIIYNVTVTVPQVTSVVLPTGIYYIHYCIVLFSHSESATTNVIIFHLPFPILISILSGKKKIVKLLLRFITVSAAVICFIGVTVTILVVCVLRWKRKRQQSTPAGQVLYTSLFFVLHTDISVGLSS